MLSVIVTDQCTCWTYFNDQCIFNWVASCSLITIHRFAQETNWIRVDARHSLFPSFFRFINYQLPCIVAVHVHVRACVLFWLMLLFFFVVHANMSYHFTESSFFVVEKMKNHKNLKRQVRKAKERYHTRLLLLLRSLIKYCWYSCCWIVFSSFSPRHFQHTCNRSCSLGFLSVYVRAHGAAITCCWWLRLGMPTRRKGWTKCEFLLCVLRPLFLNVFGLYGYVI